MFTFNKNLPVANIKDKYLSNVYFDDIPNASSVIGFIYNSNLYIQGLNNLKAIKVK